MPHRAKTPVGLNEEERVIWRATHTPGKKLDIIVSRKFFKIFFQFFLFFFSGIFFSSFRKIVDRIFSKLFLFPEHESLKQLTGVLEGVFSPFIGGVLIFFLKCCFLGKPAEKQVLKTGDDYFYFILFLNFLVRIRATAGVPQKSNHIIKPFLNIKIQYSFFVFQLQVLAEVPLAHRQP
jgi:hypothetical protein